MSAQASHISLSYSGFYGLSLSLPNIGDSVIFYDFLRMHWIAPVETTSHSTVLVPSVHHLLRSFARYACCPIDVFCNTLSIPRPGSEMDLILNVVDLHDECIKHGPSIRTIPE